MEEWQHRPRTGYLEGRQSTSAHDNGRACLDVGEIPARQCSQLLVPPARWLRARPDPPHLDRSARPQTAHCPLEICHPWRDPGGRCHEASLRHPRRRNHFIVVPRGLISRVGSGRADRRKQWLQYAAIQCGPTLPSPLTSRMRDCGASRSVNGDRMGGPAGIKAAAKKWARATDSTDGTACWKMTTLDGVNRPP